MGAETLEGASCCCPTRLLLSNAEGHKSRWSPELEGFSVTTCDFYLGRAKAPYPAGLVTPVSSGIGLVWGGCLYRPESVQPRQWNLDVEILGLPGFGVA